MLDVRTRESIRSWMFDQALPFWATHGLDLDNGGYVEQLTLDGRGRRGRRSSGRGWPAGRSMCFRMPR